MPLVSTLQEGRLPQSGALGAAWDPSTVEIGMRRDSDKTSDMLPLTLGKTEVAQ